MAKTLRDYGLNSDAVLGTPEATQFLVAQGKPPTTVSTSLPPLNTGIGSGSTGTGSQTVIPPIGSGSSTPTVTPPVSTAPTNPPPTGLFGATPPATGNFQFANVLQTAVDRLGTNNELMKQKNLLVKALYDAPLSPDELKLLPPQIQAQVASFNAKSPDPAMRANLEMQLRLTNDSIAGRNSTMNQSIKFLTEEYGKSATNLEKQRQDAIANVLDFAKVYGPNTKAALKSLYGQDYLDQLKAQGVDIDSFSGIPTPKGSDLTPGQIQSNINQITGQFDNEPIVKNYNTVAEGYQFAKSLQTKKDPTSADDQGLIYAFAKAMDPNSAVREGEYTTVQKYAQSFVQTGWANAKRLAENVAFLTPEARKNMVATIESKYKISEKNYKNVHAEYQRRLDDAKKGVITGSITDYSAAFGEGSDSDKASVLSDIQDDIRTLSKQMTREQLAQELANDYSELTPAQIQGIIYKALPNGWEKNGIQEVNEIPEIVGGYDITSYATDPKHGEKVASIFEGIPNIVTAKDAESYIKKIAPDSPVTGQSVIASSQKTKVDPKMILAIMQQDSTFGTAGKAIRTKNPGNVGNDDSGRLVTYADWSKGVLAVAQNLSKRKIT